jgi:hypothetical protein
VDYQLCGLNTDYQLLQRKGTGPKPRPVWVSGCGYHAPRARSARWIGHSSRLKSRDESPRSSGALRNFATLTTPLRGTHRTVSPAAKASPLSATPPRFEIMLLTMFGLRLGFVRVRLARCQLIPVSGLYIKPIRPCQLVTSYPQVIHKLPGDS